MTFTMPKTRPPYLHRFVTRHGKVVWYFRKRGEKVVRIDGVYGTKPFYDAYLAAANGTPLEKVEGPKKLSIAWCINRFMESPQWEEYASETRKQMSYQFARVKDNAGKAIIRDVTRQHILEARQARIKTPSDANKYIRAMTMLFKFAVEMRWVSISPVTNFKKSKTSKTGEGFYTAQISDFEAFEARWPIGTMQRLAYEIYVCTGVRRGDAHRFGKQHIKPGAYKIKTKKTGAHVEADMLPRLLNVIKATKTGDFVLLQTSHGKPFASSAALGNWFGDACRKAGTTCNAHSFRKGVAVIAAEGGASEAWMNSFFGWTPGSREGATYIAKADKRKMASPVGKIIAQTLDFGVRKKAKKP